MTEKLPETFSELIRKLDDKWSHTYEDPPLEPEEEVKPPSIKGITLED